jgi:hypothetical protein
MRIMVQSLFFTTLCSTCGGTKSAGGPIHRGDCFLPPLRLQEEWGEFFNRIPENYEKSISLEDAFLKDLGFYSTEAHYQLSTFRVPETPQMPLFPPHEYQPPPFWTCRRFMVGSGSI